MVIDNPVNLRGSLDALPQEGSCAPETSASFVVRVRASRARAVGAQPQRTGLSVARARALLAVSEGSSYTEAAQLVGRAVGDSIAQWVARFNQVGLAAVERQAGGRPPTQYGAEERDRILAEFRRRPDRERDGTATWSLNTLQRTLRRAPDGLPKVSTYTIWAVLHDAGITWQRNRTWCDTGVAIRRRKSGEVTVQDPDPSAEKG